MLSKNLYTSFMVKVYIKNDFVHKRTQWMFYQYKWVTMISMIYRKTSYQFKWENMVLLYKEKHAEEINLAKWRSKTKLTGNWFQFDRKNVFRLMILKILFKNAYYNVRESFY